MFTMNLIKQLGDAEYARSGSYAHAMGVMEGILVTVAFQSREIEEVVRKIVNDHLETLSQRNKP